MASWSPAPTDDVGILKTREASPSHFLLKVESFSLLGKNEIHRYESGEFNAGGHKWRLILYPNEDKTGKDKDYISVSLAISDVATSLHSEVNAFFSIFVMNQILGNYHYSSGRTRRFMAVKSEWCFSQFISKKVLKDPSNGFLINDNCVFGVEVFVVGTDRDNRLSFHKRLRDFMWLKLKGCFTECDHVKDQTHDEHEYEATILEIREASPTHFLTKIKSFSLLGKQGNQTGEFDAGGYKWRLIICGNEDKGGTESRYISVYLAITDTTNSLQLANWEADVVFSIFLFNQISGKYHYSLGRTRRFLAMKSKWGISDFISKKFFMDPSNGFLIDNNCVFGAEVFIVKKLAVSECLSVKNVTVPYKHYWKISNFSQSGHCWTSDQFVAEGINWDVYLKPNGHCLEAHLRLIDSAKRVKVLFSICIKDQINNKHKKRADSVWFSPLSMIWGWRGFIELATLEDPKNGFIINDCCVLGIELSVKAVV